MLRFNKTMAAWCFMLTCGLLLASSVCRANDQVVLQLKWTHAFQFAGYYAAQELGYYHDEGLDVVIREAAPGIDPVEEVAQGRAQYGVGNTSLLLARQQGVAVVVLSVVFQHSPVVLITNSGDGVTSLKALAGKRVMIEPNSAEIFAYLIREGISLDEVQIVEHSYQAKDLMNGMVDALTAYTNYEPYFLNKKGFRFRQFSPREAGIDFYGDNLFTTEAEIENNPEQVEAFRRASMKGWTYAMAHQEEIITLITKKYGKDLPRPLLQFEAQAMHDLVLSQLVKIGYSNPERWQRIVETYQSLGQVQQMDILDGFLYQPKLSLLAMLKANIWQFVGVTLFILLVCLGLAIFSLKRIVAAKTRAIEDREKRLRYAQSMESIGALVGGIAHDFNNILAATLGATFLAKRKFGEDKYFTMIESQSERASGIVKQLLAFARKGVHSMERISLTEMIRQSEPLFKLAVPESIQVKVDVCAGRLPIKGDTVQLQKVIMNLVNNAREALFFSDAPALSIIVSVSSLPEKFRSASGVANVEQYACVAVSDNGHGIDGQSLQHIFEPFFTQKEVGKGIGLGLSMVQGTVESHGGWVDVESTVDEGTVFCVYLPLLDALNEKAEVVAAEAVSMAVDKASGEYILLVDDEAELREINCAILEGLGYRVIEAADGVQAVKKFKVHKHNIKLVLMDVVMPRMGGLSAAIQIREVLDVVPIVFVTGYDRFQVLDNVEEKLGCSALISKPFKAEALHGLMQAMMRGKQS